MSNRVDLYNSTYGNFQAQVLAEIRRETYGEDIGQNSWITTDEYDTFYSWLSLSAGDHVLEIASGSGGRPFIWQRNSNTELLLYHLQTNNRTSFIQICIPGREVD